MKHTFFLHVSLGLAALSPALQAQTVTTHAGVQYLGSGSYLSTPNNTVTTEKFSRPSGLAIDNNGILYITDEHNVLLIEGTNTRIRAGYLGDPNEPGAIGTDDGTGTVSRFFAPAGMAVSGANDLYVCDRFNHTIRKVSKYVNASNGQIVSTYAGKASFTGGHKDGTLGSAIFNEPADCVFDGSGNLIVVDFFNDCIRKVTSNLVSTLCGSPGNTGSNNGTGSAARFYAPSGICLESGTSALVADKNNNAIRRINLSTGEVSTVVSTGINSPNDVVVVGNSIFIIENTCIKVYNGTSVSLFCGNATTPGYTNATGNQARFEQLRQVVYSAANNCLYVTDEGNNVIRKVTLNPAPTVDFSATPTSATVGQTVAIKENTQFGETFTWSITPANYTLLNGSTLNSKTVYLAFTTSGTYSVTLTAGNASGSNQATKNNYINVSNIAGVAPVANFIADKTSAAVNEEINLIDQSSNNPTAWSWTIAPSTFTYEGGTASSSRFPKVKFTAAGIYSVSLTASNSVGPNTSNKNNYITIGGSTSIADFNPLQIGIFPNPASDKIQVSISGSSGASTLRLFTLDGREVRQWTGLLSGIHGLDLPASLGNGIYLMRLDNGSHIQQTRLHLVR
ncbi:MAG: PKD domain-containing protein [Bacteroidia bacterium]